MGRGLVWPYLMGLPGGHLSQVIDLLMQFRFDEVQGFQELLGVVLCRLLAGLFLAQLGEGLSWKGMAYMVSVGLDR